MTLTITIGTGFYNVYKSKGIIKMCFSGTPIITIIIIITINVIIINIIFNINIELSDAGLLPEESNTIDVTVGEAKILYPF